MTIYSSNQQQIAEQIAETNVTLSQWKDWHWQLKHAIRTLDTAESLLGVSFAPAERQLLEQTLGRFPLSVTPYYLSLIDTTDVQNDPVFRQAFPSPREIEIERHDMSDPLAEDDDSPVPGVITHRYPDRA